MITVKKLEDKYLDGAINAWNQVVEDGIAFPQETCLGSEDGREFLYSQTYTGVAVDNETDEVLGMYILHPNNVGRCGHICNASYAVKRVSRGQHVGEALVRDCIKMGRECGFRILQFNAVVATNITALSLYKKLGFKQLGVIPEGFRMDDGHYEDIIPHCIKL